MIASTHKNEVIEALHDLPEENTIAEAMERLYVLYKIQKGVDAAEAGKILTHEEAKERLSKWIV